MHRYEELEKEYERRKKKRILFLILTIFTFILFSIIGYLIFNKVTEQKIDRPKVTPKVEKRVIKTPKIEDKNITHKHQKIEVVEDKKVVVKKEEKKVEVIKTPKIKDKNAILPIIPKIEIETEYKLYLKPFYPDVNNLLKIEKEKWIKKHKQQDKKSEPKKEEKRKVEKKIEKKIQVDEVKVIKTIKAKRANLMILIDNFNKHNNYNDAIKIAKILYNKGNYKSAIDWSFKANSINPETPDSWIIYAESLKKLNRVSDAKKVLQSYLDNYGTNERIMNLLRSIN